MGDLLAEAAFQSALVVSAVVVVVVWATRHAAHPFGWASAALVGSVVGLAIGSIAPAVVWAVVLLAAAGALVNGRTAWLAVPLGVGAGDRAGAGRPVVRDDVDAGRGRRGDGRARPAHVARRSYAAAGAAGAAAGHRGGRVRVRAGDRHGRRRCSARSCRPRCSAC